MKPNELLARTTSQAELAINAISRRMQLRLGESVRRRAVQTPDGLRLTATSVLAIMRDVDAILVELYPPARGAVESPLTAIIERFAGAVRQRPLDDAINAFRDALGTEPEVLRAIEQDIDAAA